VSLSWLAGGGRDDRFLDLEVVQPVGERGVVRDLFAARDLVEEGAGLVDEAVVVAMPVASMASPPAM
jgi:hypothetical protein